MTLSTTAVAEPRVASGRLPGEGAACPLMEHTGRCGCGGKGSSSPVPASCKAGGKQSKDSSCLGLFQG